MQRDDAVAADNLYEVQKRKRPLKVQQCNVEGKSFFSVACRLVVGCDMTLQL